MAGADGEEKDGTGAGEGVSDTDTKGTDEMMPPKQYEQRCAEMLRRNAHNLSVSEIERLAYGSNDAIMRMLAAQMDEIDSSARHAEDNQIENALDHARSFMR